VSTEEPLATPQHEPFDPAGALMNDMLADGHLTRREMRYADTAPVATRRFGRFAEVWLAVTLRVGFISLRVHRPRLR